MKKRKYFKPEIVLVQLDSEISLALQSYPPYGPEEAAIITDTNNNNVMKIGVM